MQFSGSVPVRLFPPPSTGEGEGGGAGGGKGSKAQEGEGKIENYMALARGRSCLTVEWYLLQCQSQAALSARLWSMVSE